MSDSGRTITTGDLPASVVNGSYVGATPGLYLPPDWGSFWKPKRAAALAGTGKATIAVVGDSVARGFYSSNLDTKGWASLLRIALQALYGDGGSGYKSMADTAFAMNAAGIPAAAVTAWASQEPTLTGTWARNLNLGPGSFSLNHSTAGATITATVRGTSASVIYLTGAGLGSFTWTVDGVAQGTVATAGATGSAKATASGLGAGTHTIVITAGAATPAIYIAGVSGENATGVVLNNFSRTTTQSADYNQTDAFGAGWSGGPNYPADLVLYCLGINDTGIGTVTADNWALNVRRYFDNQRLIAAPATDGVLVLPHVGQADLATLYAAYLIRARGLAEAYGLAFLDIWRLGRNSWNYWNALNYWSVEDGSGGAGTSSDHPSDAGHAYMESLVEPILTAA